jgi:hypothetical protein
MSGGGPGDAGVVEAGVVAGAVVAGATGEPVTDSEGDPRG